MTKSSVAARPAQRKSKAALVRPQARFRMRVGRGDEVAVGPGKVALLEAIQAERSITAAAKSMGMSYRRAWALVDEVNASLRAPAVESSIGGERGGGSRLTEAGEEVVMLYRRIEVQAAMACARDIERLIRLLV